MRRAGAQGHTDAVLAVDAHPHAAMVASAGTELDKTIRIWERSPHSAIESVAEQ